MKEKKIVDMPGGRKIHKKFTPSMGGIAIFVAFIISFLIWSPEIITTDARYLILSLSLMVIMGLRDDIVPMKPKNKLIIQILAAFLVVNFSGAKLESLYGLFYVYEMHFMVQYALSIFVFLVIINAFNLIDGLDGLASSIALVIFTFYSIYFTVNEAYFLAVVCFIMCGSLAGFLVYNWEPAKIFMGDTGSLFIGFLLTYITIHFIDFNYKNPEIPFHFQSSVGAAIAIIAIPLWDTSKVFISRIYRKRSPFAPDKMHVHHLIMRLGNSHKKTVLILIGVQIFFILIAVIFSHWKNLTLFIFMIGITITGSLFLDRLISKNYPNSLAKRKRFYDKN
ncbi:MAG: undecaprenyl/decaprenyl-phosphate alpha-N-acetylglucosaminyl 1-phosphate transferase [Cyclobacteriaceae bacterium]|nr:undecaprenyl/decaprenyl-phosphate alpha-N-acetylglucosaminyl 1-phosphate transferase [Cyclobacteriaceae bacterium]MCH8517242.1 undecaprenyl/decaprenyl-phosphate alpha-N-acetylglucosaminyl 1-phosphate transferase [Cyclobacteriaceae bacterium]